MAYWERVPIEPDPVGLTRRERTGGPYFRYHPDVMSRASEVLDADTLAYALDVASAVSAIGSRLASRPLPMLYATLARSESISSSWIEGERETPRNIMIARLDHPRSTHQGHQVARNIAMMWSAVQTFGEGEWGHEQLHEIQHELLPGRPRGYRTVQSYIGGTSALSADYVPPPAELVQRYMDDLLEYVNVGGDAPLVAAVLLHAQFETIHPYTDGNGRVGRALFHGMLARGGVVTRGVLPLSIALRRDINGYVGALTAYRHDGDDREVRQQAVSKYTRQFLGYVEAAVRLTDQVVERVGDTAERWAERLARFRRDSSIHRAAEILVEQPVVTIPYLQRHLGVSKVTANTTVRNLESAGILEPASGKYKRSDLFQASEILNILDWE